ncbi:hypothetical protein GCM10028857_08570 [Salinarchaeum chitinilyticum]
MNGEDPAAATEYSEPRVPAPLRDRVERLFVAERGYEPASFQEALSVVLDVADEARDPLAAAPEQRMDEDPGESAASSSSAPPVTDTPTDTDDEPPADRSIDVGVDEASLERSGDDSVSFDEYVDGLEETRQDPSPAVESILDTEHADSVVRDLAAEVLEEMTQDAFQELEHGVDHGVAGVTDGMGSTATADGSGTAPSESTGDGVPESLTADPTSDCAVCGRSHPVSVLHTTILEDEGSVALVCPSCAE